MNVNKMFELGGLNLWVVASGNGLNLILQGLVFLAAAMLGNGAGSLSQVILLLGTFLSTLATAFVCGRMERERYLSYAGYTLPGNLILSVPSVLFAGVFGVMIVAVAIMGAFNGARLAEITVRKHSR